MTLQMIAPTSKATMRQTTMAAMSSLRWWFGRAGLGWHEIEGGGHGRARGERRFVGADRGGAGGGIASELEGAASACTAPVRR